MRTIILIIALVFVGCKEDKPTENQLQNEDKVIEVYHRLYKGGCLGYCDTKLIIDSTKIRYIQKGWDVTEEGEFKDLPTFDSTYSNTSEGWNTIVNLIDMDEVMKLDSAYMNHHNGEGVSEGYIELSIKTNNRFKKVKFLNKKELNPIDSLSNYLINLRESLQ